MIGRKRERRLSEFGRRGCWRRGSSRVGQATISIVGSDRRGGSTDPIHPSDVGGTFDQPTSPTSNDRTPLPMNPCPQRTLQRPVQDHLSSVLEPPPKDEGRLRSPRARRGPKSPSLSSSRSATPPRSLPEKRGVSFPAGWGSSSRFTQQVKSSGPRSIDRHIDVHVRRTKPVPHRTGTSEPPNCTFRTACPTLTPHDHPPWTTGDRGPIQERVKRALPTVLDLTGPRRTSTWRRLGPFSDLEGPRDRTLSKKDSSARTRPAGAARTWRTRRTSWDMNSGQG